MNVAESTSRKQGDLCRIESKSTTRIYNAPKPRPPPFLSMPTRLAIIRFRIKFIDQDSHWYTCRVKEAVHVRLHPNNINGDSRIEIPEAWMPRIKEHNRNTRGRPPRVQLLAGTMRIEIQSNPVITDTVGARKRVRITECPY